MFGSLKKQNNIIQQAYEFKIIYKSFIIQNQLEMSSVIVYLGVPTSVNLSQFTNVQRGTIFMWFVSVLIIFIVTAIRLVSGNLDPEGEKYQQGKSKPQSSQSFQKVVIKSQILTEDDSGSTRLFKKTAKFSTILVPLTITFALGFVIGASYAFSLVLYFLILLPLVLFNLLEFHKWIFDHKAFICIFDNLWVIATFFWLLNMWTTGKYWQPYYITQVNA